jgi:hypothetical protein
MLVRLLQTYFRTRPQLLCSAGYRLQSQRKLSCITRSWNQNNGFPVAFI